MSESILTAALASLRENGALDGRRLDRVTVGERALLVELRTTESATPSQAGLAHRPRDAGRSIAADSVGDLLAPIHAPGDGNRLDLAAAVATLNALSSPTIEWHRGDPMELLGSAVDTVVTVGLFRPAIRKFDDVEMRVIERDTEQVVEAPDGVSVRLFPTTATETAMDGADVVFITGSTLLYGGLDSYLAAAPETATVVLVGATASFCPDPLFAAGVDVVAGAVVSEPEQTRRAVRDGACGTDLHESGVEKVYTVAETAAHDQRLIS